MAEPNHRRTGLILAAAIFMFDQIIKWAVINPLALMEVRNIPIIPIFDLTWVENYGVSLGLFTAHSEGQRWALVLITAAIAGFVAHWLWREKNQADVVGLGLILGGALGNIVDRARLGYVVDYADLHFGDFRPFLVFNVADAAITIGVLILLARALLVREPKSVENENA